MKLTTMQIQRTLDQIEGQAIPDDNPVIAQLSEAYGDHTFFLDGDGLNIVEPTDGGAQKASVVKLASWVDAKRTALAPHEPQMTDTVVDIAPE